MADEIEDGPAALGVFGRRDIVFGFVEQYINEVSGDGDLFAIDFDGVGWKDFGAGFSDGFAVDGDLSLADEVRRIAPGADAGMGDVFIEGEKIAVGWRGRVLGRLLGPCGGALKGGDGSGRWAAGGSRSGSGGWAATGSGVFVGLAEIPGLATFFEVAVDGGLTFLFRSFFFLPEGLLDGSVVLFVIELAEIVRFALHWLVIAVLQQ